MCGKSARLPAPRWSLALVAGALVGCGGDRFEERVLACAKPSGALASADPELVQLIAEVAQSKGLPADLDGPLGPPQDNSAAALAACFSDELCLQLRPYVEGLVLQAEPSDERADFLKRNALLVNKVAAATDLPRCRFDVDHAFGFFGRMRFLDDAALGSHLLTLRAAESARRDEPAAAAADLRRALVTAHRLAAVRRVEARVLAEALRSATLAYAERLFVEAKLGRAEAETLYGTLREHLADWPDNARMLTGERAVVTHAYEAIRNGMLERVLTLDERKRLSEAGLLDRLREAPPDALDADQADYLEAMRRVIDSADLPAVERDASVTAALASARDGPLLFAAPLFLVDLTDALDAAVTDRARCEAWAIALASSAGLRPPPFRVSPATGEAYEATRETGRVAVTLGDPEGETVVLPILGG